MLLVVLGHTAEHKLCQTEAGQRKPYPRLYCGPGQRYLFHVAVGCGMGHCLLTLLVRNMSAIAQRHWKDGEHDSVYEVVLGVNVRSSGP